MKIRFVRDAQREFFDAIAYYEGAQEGLGLRFKGEVDRCLSWIAQFPQLHRLRVGSCRRINLKAFPYYLPYLVRDETLWILAVAHGRRRPSYWIRRRNEAV